jgi:hypothetical protein
VADGVSAEREARPEREAAAWLQDAARLLTEAGHAPECRSCPVCRGIVTLRQLGPDLLDQVARVATDLAAGLREQAARQDPGDATGQAGGQAPGAGGEEAHRAEPPQAGRAPEAAPSWWGRPPGAGEVPRTEWIDITD